MECKNCDTDLSDQYKYCRECGAKVINERITFRKLLGEAFNQTFGWDNKFFITLKTLITRP